MDILTIKDLEELINVDQDLFISILYLIFKKF